MLSDILILLKSPPSDAERIHIVALLTEHTETATVRASETSARTFLVKFDPECDRPTDMVQTINNAGFSCSYVSG